MPVSRVPLPQRLQGFGREHQPFISLHGEVSKAVRQLAKIRQAKRGQAEVGAQFLEMFASGLITQQAQLDGKAEPIGVASALPNQGQIGLGKAVMLDQVVLALRERQ
ncbi:hypothetical protein ACFDR9_005540 [Janthinobacterium sp. CG_23.3]